MNQLICRGCGLEFSELEARTEPKTFANGTKHVRVTFQFSPNGTAAPTAGEGMQGWGSPDDWGCAEEGRKGAE